MPEKKPKIMVFCDHYLPSKQSGGGMWTIVRLVERFSHLFDFYIVCRNYDSKSLREQFADVGSDKWNKFGKENVFYCSQASIKSDKFAKLVSEVKPQAIFLNSVFSTVVIKLLYARLKGKIADMNVILAPCGETAKAALAIKSSKKTLYLALAKLLGLYKGVIWKASFEAEKQEIFELFGRDIEVVVAPDLTPESILPEYDQSKKIEKSPGSAKFIFVSRISKKKNLKYLLEVFANLKNGEIVLEIVGPVEDEDYWSECQTIINDFPVNIKVISTGGVGQAEALDRLVESHFFVLPTLNENFGYVFIESLAAGTPIIISDKTIWNDIDRENVGSEISLKNKQRWMEKLEECVSMDQVKYSEMSCLAREYALKYLKNSDMLDANLRVLERSIANK